MDISGRTRDSPRIALHKGIHHGPGSYRCLPALSVDGEIPSGKRFFQGVPANDRKQMEYLAKDMWNFRLNFGLQNRAKDDSRKASKAIYRRFTQIDTERKPCKNLPQRRRGRRELNFCLSGDDDKQNISQIRAKSFCPIVVSRLGKSDFLSVLCVSAVKCPNPYLR